MMAASARAERGSARRDEVAAARRALDIFRGAIDEVAHPPTVEATAAVFMLIVGFWVCFVFHGRDFGVARAAGTGIASTAVVSVRGKKGKLVAKKKKKKGKKAKKARPFFAIFSTLQLAVSPSFVFCTVWGTSYVYTSIPS